MAALNRGEVWLIDFGMVAKVRPALLLTGSPADDELDLVTVLLHTTALRGNRWELSIPKPFLKSGAFHLQQVQTVLYCETGAEARRTDRQRNGASNVCVAYAIESLNLSPALKSTGQRCVKSGEEILREEVRPSNERRLRIALITRLSF
jgi:mRNA interferase MazF